MRLVFKKFYLPPYGKTDCEPISSRNAVSRGVCAQTEVKSRETSGRRRLEGPKTDLVQIAFNFPEKADGDGSPTTLRIPESLAPSSTQPRAGYIHQAATHAIYAKRTRFQHFSRFHCF